MIVITLPGSQKTSCDRWSRRHLGVSLLRVEPDLRGCVFVRPWLTESVRVSGSYVFLQCFVVKGGVVIETVQLRAQELVPCGAHRVLEVSYGLVGRLARISLALLLVDVKVPFVHKGLVICALFLHIGLVVFGNMMMSRPQLASVPDQKSCLTTKSWVFI